MPRYVKLVPIKISFLDFGQSLFKEPIIFIITTTIEHRY